ncbi:DmsC/YnfH family molybdoenzyme membrane anchor subunit [Chimaeribacter arupi]|uniref:Dimethylsulfoxide reductase n=1 Tax=Chimaeribacter arupi TaxID=2060066 RepID=A0A2N5ETP1_9GAMM|nr:DmsC/YnfH family molybdoenzyme membrane anchor subunit [Chimaeribacter arupi]PLR53477.1 dimethylsulfoxide reductase [Chimaeribacter arupi]PLR54065.1 dimethylsulfoxide reductase [Chimaeribacter arupi]
MGTGWHEWPLIIFTVLGQCVVGAFIAMAWVLAEGKQDSRVVHTARMRMFFLWVVMGVAFVASVMHLGSPLRAFNALNRLGASPLSNEIACGSLFFALGGLYWLLAVCKTLPTALSNFWLLVTSLAGIGFVYAMGRVYHITTVPTWDPMYTSLSFALTALIGGPLLGGLLLRSAGVAARGSVRWLPLVSLLALVISAVVWFSQVATVNTLHSSVQSASSLVPALGALLGWRLALIAIGLGCWIVPQVTQKAPGVFILASGLALVVAGELLGRGIFYGLHMTVGLTYGG